MNILEKNLSLLNFSFDFPKIKLYKAKDKYIFKQDKDPLNLGIIEKESKKALFANPLQDFISSHEFYLPKYKLYPVMFVYGMNNSLFIQTMLKNPSHKLIIIIEDDLSLLKLIFSSFDFGINAKRLILISPSSLNENSLYKLLNFRDIKPYLKCFSLLINGKSYEEDKALLKTAHIFNKTIKSLVLIHGNDPVDAVIGIRHTLFSLPYLLKSPSLKQAYYERSKITRKNASSDFILVSTGPSLKKQLSLLKAYQDKACIICADSAYPILAKENITPDYVLCLERTAPTAQLFKQSFPKVDENITFLVACLVHPSFFSFIGKRHFLLAQRALPFAQSLGLKSYFSIGTYSSVAHMGIELAYELGGKRLFIIGQDLAYDTKGSSHCAGYLHGERYESDGAFEYEKYKAIAYGGEGMVDTHEVWQLFNEQITLLAQRYKDDLKIYNCTQGGARIKGCIEAPFDGCCKEFLLHLKPIFPPLAKTNKEEIMLDAHKAYKSLKHIIKRAKLAIISFAKLDKKLTYLGFDKLLFKDAINVDFTPFLDLASLGFKDSESAMLDYYYEHFDEALYEKAAKLCDDYKLEFCTNDPSRIDGYMELIWPSSFHLELNLAKLLCINVPSPLMQAKAKMIINYQFSALYQISLEIKMFLRMMNQDDYLKNTLKKVKQIARGM